MCCNVLQHVAVLQCCSVAVLQCCSVAVLQHTHVLLDKCVARTARLRQSCQIIHKRKCTHLCVAVRCIMLQCVAVMQAIRVMRALAHTHTPSYTQARTYARTYAHIHTNMKETYSRTYTHTLTYTYIHIHTNVKVQCKSV